MKVGDVVRFTYDPELPHSAKFSEMLLKSTSGQRGRILSIEYDNKRETFKIRFRSFYGVTLEVNEEEITLEEAVQEPTKERGEVKRGRAKAEEMDLRFLFNARLN